MCRLGVLLQEEGREGGRKEGGKEEVGRKGGSWEEVAEVVGAEIEASKKEKKKRKGREKIKEEEAEEEEAAEVVVAEVALALFACLLAFARWLGLALPDSFQHAQPNTTIAQHRPTKNSECHVQASKADKKKRKLSGCAGMLQQHCCGVCIMHGPPPHPPTPPVMCVCELCWVDIDLG